MTYSGTCNAELGAVAVCNAGSRPQNRVNTSPSVSQPRVECLLEKQVKGRWTRVQRKRINVRGGRFATKVKPKTAGLYRVSIIADDVVRRRTLRALR